MSIVESIMVGIFCMALVFALLAVLFYIVKIFSFGLRAVEGRRTGGQKEEPEIEPVRETEEKRSEEDFSTGELKLVNVDEKTAAMIMAIVSDESQIPLAELCFKSIKAVEDPEFK